MKGILAPFCQPNHEGKRPAFLGRVASRIVHAIKGIDRVVHDFTSKPPGRLDGSEGRRWSVYVCAVARARAHEVPADTPLQAAIPLALVELTAAQDSPP